MLSGSPWSYRGAPERWFGGRHKVTHSHTAHVPKCPFVHGRPCHNLKQHNYEPSAYRLPAQHHIDPPPEAPRGASRAALGSVTDITF
eukprot:4677371-Prymnesium_polylepis.1